MPGPSRHSVTCGSLKILCGRERSFHAVNQGTVAFNRKLIEIAQRNINSSFDLAKSLAGAKNFAEVMELQAAQHNPSPNRSNLGTLEQPIEHPA
jgi:hypothetical protein